MKAYEALRRRKREGQSFSDVIKEHFQGGPTGSVLKRAIQELRLSESTLDAVERIVLERSKDAPKIPKL